MFTDDQILPPHKNGASRTRKDLPAMTDMPVDVRVWREDAPHLVNGEAVGLRPQGWYLPVRAGIEFAIALVLLVISAPVILLAALLVKLTSEGPAFYSQVRVGKYGRLFWLHKIRTMTHNCEDATGPCWSKPGDQRVTRIGRFLRRTHLDELPQLWNVLRGEMSLVGPRPERPEFVPVLDRAIPHYRARLVVRPGITGLAQVQLPADTDLASVQRKLVYDLYYIRHMGPWLDLRLVVCTGARMLGVPFHVLTPLFRMPGAAAVEQHSQAAQAGLADATDRTCGR
jgi:lipopolysaccharide/colanic/teichoic acid biosynthesis glycosyltransferase